MAWPYDSRRWGITKAARAQGVQRAASVFLRKANQRRRLPLDRIMRPLQERLEGYWSGGATGMVEHLRETGGLERLQRYLIQTHPDLVKAVVRRRGEEAARKAADAADRWVLAGLLANYGYYDDVAAAAEDLVKLGTMPGYEQAAQFSLERIGIKADFELRNEAVKARLLDRAAGFQQATGTSFAQAQEVLLQHFYDLGAAPLNTDFLDDLMAALDLSSRAAAEKTARTETGIAASQATRDVYRRNGVPGKEWSGSGRSNMRESHRAVDGTVKKMDELFTVGGELCDGPHDPRLSAGELINCACDLLPVVDDGWAADAANAWLGE